jgi:Protein of unknown function (DUF3040)
VPLSEHEQRLLEQMERALYAEDPKLASTLRGADLRAHQRRRVVVGSLGVLVGLGLLLAGVSIGWPLGVVGFLVMLASAWWITSGWRSSSAPTAGGTPGRTSRPGRTRTSKAAKNSSGVMDRFEDRWRRRREGNDS